MKAGKPYSRAEVGASGPAGGRGLRLRAYNSFLRQSSLSRRRSRKLPKFRLREVTKKLDKPFDQSYNTKWSRYKEDAMELDVSKGFLKPAEAFPFEAEVVLPPQEVNGETVSFDPVALQGTYTVYDCTVKLEGELETVAHARCALCMQPADFPVHVKFSEDFRKDADEMEDEFFRFEGKKVPLDHMTLTLVVLELPMRFECREGCPGSEELQAWNENNPVSSNDAGASTQHPFEALRSLLEPRE